MSDTDCQDVITTDSAPEAKMIHFSENHIMYKNRFYSEELLFLFIYMLNRILIHILYWLGRTLEIDHLIIYYNKRAGESKLFSSHILSAQEEVLLY